MSRSEKREEIMKTMNGVQNTVAVTTTMLIMKVVLPKIIIKKNKKIKNMVENDKPSLSAGFFLQLAGSLSSPRGLSTISPQFEFRKRSLLSDGLWPQIQWPSCGDSHLHHRPECDQSSITVAMDFCWAP